jgi:TPR repeat protein
MYKLALRYLYSKPRKPGNVSEALRLLNLAAEAGHAEAHYHLGFCYKHGIGVDIDAEEALRWFRLAAGAGSANGLYYVGLCFKFGRGTAVDMAEGIRLCRQAADAGCPDAQYNIGVWSMYGTDGVNKDVAKALTFFEVPQRLATLPRNTL